MTEHTLRILEISSGAGAAYAGLLLAEQGCHVTRFDAAQPGDAPLGADPEAAEIFLHRDRPKTTDIGAVIGSVDAVIEDAGPGRLASLGWPLERMHALHRRLVIVSLSPFGAGGPCSDWAATDLTVQAVGGVLHAAGHDGDPPRRIPGEAAAMIAGVHGATAVSSLLYGLETGTSEAVQVDISAQDTFMQHWTRHVADYAYSGMTLKRQQKEPEGIHRRHTTAAADGWVFLLALQTPWQDVAAFLGLDQHLTPERMNPDAEQPWEEMRQDFINAVQARGRYDWFEAAASMGWTFAPVEDPLSVLNGPQTSARESTTAVTVDGIQIQVPRGPCHFDRVPP